MAIDIAEQDWTGTPGSWRREVWFTGAETIELLINAVSEYGKSQATKSHANFDWDMKVLFLKGEPEDKWGINVDDVAATFPNNPGGSPLPGWATFAESMSWHDECPSDDSF